jgi:four helix bundle protein
MFFTAFICESSDFLDKQSGELFALSAAMAGLRRFQDFAAWRRAEELRILVLHFLDRPGVRSRLTSADHLEESAASAPRNIAEGYGRFKPKQFAQYVRVALGSENEVLNCLIEARNNGLLSNQEFARFEVAARRAIGTGVRLAQYLDSCDPNGPWHR